MKKTRQVISTAREVTAEHRMNIIPQKQKTNSLSDWQQFVHSVSVYVTSSNKEQRKRIHVVGSRNMYPCPCSILWDEDWINKSESSKGNKRIPAFPVANQRSKERNKQQIKLATTSAGTKRKTIFIEPPGNAETGISEIV